MLDIALSRARLQIDYRLRHGRLFGIDREKYYQYLYRSYVERNRNRKWCPAPGCNLAIEFDAGRCENYDVTCDCSHKFCWKCMEESHSPMDCKTVANWIQKNSSEAENTNNWKLAYTKLCPKCCRPIHKIQGCNHMTCESPCGFQLLLGVPWTRKDHANFYSCNKYKGESVSIDEKSRLNANKHLELYTHYYERWDSNEKSRKRALFDLNRARNEDVDVYMLALERKEPLDQLQFVSEAWDQIVECRRVLKWTYAYGYYLSLKKYSRKIFSSTCKGRQAEAALERLHHCAEEEMF